MKALLGRDLVSLEKGITNMCDYYNLYQLQKD
jgi:hypothetical protein